MAVTALSSTTLTNAIVASDNVNIVVGSTASISVGQYLLFAGRAGYEVAKVQAIPVSGQVNLMRGVAGSKARAQDASTLIYIGNPTDFKNVRDNAVALVGDSGSLPEYCYPGVRAIDAAGNHYIMVDLTQTVVPGATILISKDGAFTASALTSTSVGSVGVITEDATSNQWTWAQVYGYVAHAKLVGGSSLVTSVGEFQGASSVSTPSVGLLGRSSSQRSSAYLEAAVVNGMFPASAASTASTSASSETGLFCAAWLNYPWIQRAITS